MGGGEVEGGRIPLRDLPSEQLLAVLPLPLLPLPSSLVLIGQLKPMFFCRVDPVAVVEPAAQGRHPIGQRRSPKGRAMPAGLLPSHNPDQSLLRQLAELRHIQKYNERLVIA